MLRDGISAHTQLYLQQPDGTFTPHFLFGLRPIALLQADDDPALELLAQLHEGGLWLLDPAKMPRNEYVKADNGKDTPSYELQNSMMFLLPLVTRNGVFEDGEFDDAIQARMDQGQEKQNSYHQAVTSFTNGLTESKAMATARMLSMSLQDEAVDR